MPPIDCYQSFGYSIFRHLLQKQVLPPQGRFFGDAGATGLSTLVLPMGLITGIYGMNVKMPETEWEYGYPMVLLILVSIAVGGFSYLKWRKWL